MTLLIVNRGRFSGESEKVNNIYSTGRSSQKLQYVHTYRFYSVKRRQVILLVNGSHFGDKRVKIHSCNNNHALKNKLIEAGEGAQEIW